MRHSDRYGRHVYRLHLRTRGGVARAQSLFDAAILPRLLRTLSRRFAGERTNLEVRHGDYGRTIRCSSAPVPALLLLQRPDLKTHCKSDVRRVRDYSIGSRRRAATGAFRESIWIVERCSRGSVLEALDPSSLPSRVEKYAQRKPSPLRSRCCFICQSSHDARSARRSRRSVIPISLSHEILPEFREYERASTVAVNAYLAPRMSVISVNSNARD